MTWRRHHNEGYEYRDLVDARGHGETLAGFYASRYPNASPRTWRERILDGRVLRNGRSAAPDVGVRDGDRLVYSRPPWTEPAVPTDVRVVHEDPDCLVVDKPAGLPTVPDAWHLEGTLSAWLTRRYGSGHAPLHRLDRGTAGLVLVGRHRAARRALSLDIERNRVTRRYLAMVIGSSLPDRLTIEQPIGRIPYPPTRWIHAACPSGKRAETRVRVISRGAARSIVEIELVTGRPHQIRIHLAWAGAPLVGDTLYAAGGVPRSPRPGARPALPGDGGYALLAHALAFHQPHTGDHLRVSSTRPLGVPEGPVRPSHT